MGGTVTDFVPIAYAVSKASDPERWHAIRRTGVGSSDAPAVCGVSPWGGALGVYLQKVGQAPVKESSEAMLAGEWLEPAIAEMFSKKTGFQVADPGVMLRHPVHEFMICDVDRWTEDDSKQAGIVEIKNVGAHMAAKYWVDDQVPDHVKVQLQHQLCVCGAEYGWVAALLGGNHLVLERFERDENLIKALIDIEGDFWLLVQDRRPPAVDDSEEAEKVLRYCYPEAAKGSTVTLDDEQQELLRKLRLAREAQKSLDSEVRLYKNTLMQWMKDAEVAFIPGQDKPAITYKGSVTRRLDTGRLAAERPDVAAAYYVESSSRRFLVKGCDE
jgi:putative phage-type endonuclease